MTESDLRKCPEFWGHLPIYNVGETHGLKRPDDPAYDQEVTEVQDLSEFDRLRQDPGYDLKGAIRYADEVRPIFWKKKSSS